MVAAAEHPDFRRVRRKRDVTGQEIVAVVDDLDVEGVGALERHVAALGVHLHGDAVAGVRRGACLGGHEGQEDEDAREDHGHSAERLLHVERSGAHGFPLPRSAVARMSCEVRRPCSGAFSPHPNRIAHIIA